MRYSANLIISFAIFFTLISCVITADMPFTDCGNQEIQSLRIDPCDSYPCDFKVGDKVDMTVEFIANHNTSEVKLHGSLRTGGIFNYEMSYKGLDSNACNSGNQNNKLPCPLVKGKVYKFTVSQVIPYARRFNIFRYATWKLVGLYERNLICAEFAISQSFYRFFAPFLNPL